MKRFESWTGPGGGTRRLHHKHTESDLHNFKERCKIYYMVKGDLTKATIEQIEASYEGYFKKLWGNHENFYKDEGFEENYRMFMWGRNRID